jgi:phosphatidylinositol alpha-1,6-mannosyltransferase
LAARLAGARCAVYLHGLDIETKHPGYRLLWHPFLRRCDLVIANSRFTRALAEDIGIEPGRLQILHPGVKLPGLTSAADLRADFRDRYRLGEAPLMLYVGRITVRKGLLPFVREVLPQVIQTVPNARLVVIGSEPDAALLSDKGILGRIKDSLRNSGLEERVLFLGERQADDPDIGAAYFAADVQIFPVQDKPGDHEGFGMVAVEAAAHGLPTIAFAAGGVTDAVANGRSGTLVKPGDSGTFAQETIGLLSAAPDEKTALAESACAFASGFAWPAFGRRLIRLCNPDEAAES